MMLSMKSKMFIPFLIEGVYFLLIRSFAAYDFSIKIMHELTVFKMDFGSLFL